MDRPNTLHIVVTLPDDAVPVDGKTVDYSVALERVESAFAVLQAAAFDVQSVAVLTPHGILTATP